MTPTTTSSDLGSRSWFGLLRRRNCLVPTWRGWLVALLVLALAAILVLRNLYGFLAVTQSFPRGLLVVEGWMPDYAMEAALAEFRTNHYDRLVVIGGPIESGAPLSEYRSFAELGAALLVKLGLSTNAVQAVPAPQVRQDRTYAAGVALRQWLDEHQVPLTNANLVSIGPHARRSRLMLQTALGNQATVGIIALPSREYDAAHWWRSSAGFRNVTDEALAYLYARLLFRGAKQARITEQLGLMLMGLYPKGFEAPVSCRISPSQRTYLHGTSFGTKVCPSSSTNTIASSVPAAAARVLRHANTTFAPARQQPKSKCPKSVPSILLCFKTSAARAKSWGAI